MKINLFESNEQILKELGDRIRMARIRSGQTQAQMAENSGVAKTTVERAEKGESIQLLNVIKMLRSLNYIGGLEMILPSAEKTPLELLDGKPTPRRVHSRTAKPVPHFKWGDEE